MPEPETSFRKDAGLRKEVTQIRADTKEIRAALESMRVQLATVYEWVLAVQPGWALCVILQPGDCHTFQQTASGSLTITNETDEHGIAELKWNNDVFTGEVQSNSTRTVIPMAWPAEICNVGTVPLKVCPG